MPLDGITLNLLKQELSQYIVGSRIEKIHQPSKDELVFHLRSREGAYRLLLSASANSPRLHLTANAPENPSTPPLLCMLFRKHLTGAVITDIRQLGLDRVVFIDLAGTNEIGDAVTFTLCIEIMGKYSNISASVSRPETISSNSKTIEIFLSSAFSLLSVSPPASTSSPSSSVFS